MAKGSLYYAIATLAVAGAVVTGLLVESLPQTAPFPLLFLCAILFAAWLGGAGPGLLATALSILAFNYFFVSPTHSLVMGSQDILRIALFAVTALFVVWIRAYRAAVRSADHRHARWFAGCCDVAPGAVVDQSMNTQQAGRWVSHSD
jgi:K+-sensing histidine kinase KdpD